MIYFQFRVAWDVNRIIYCNKSQIYTTSKHHLHGQEENNVTQYTHISASMNRTTDLLFSDRNRRENYLKAHYIAYQVV